MGKTNRLGVHLKGAMLFQAKNKEIKKISTRIRFILSISVHVCGCNVRFSPDIKFHREALHVKAAVLRMLTSEEALCLSCCGHMLVATVNAKLPT